MFLFNCSHLPCSPLLVLSGSSPPPLLLWGLYLFRIDVSHEPRVRQHDSHSLSPQVFGTSWRTRTMRWRRYIAPATLKSCTARAPTPPTNRTVSGTVCHSLICVPHFSPVGPRTNGPYHVDSQPNKRSRDVQSFAIVSVRTTARRTGTHRARGRGTAATATLTGTMATPTSCPTACPPSPGW